MTARIIKVATLVTYSLDHMNRVYSPEGIAPTISTCGGGNLEPKILIERGARGMTEDTRNRSKSN